jgi:hypothetical protein
MVGLVPGFIRSGRLRPKKRPLFAGQGKLSCQEISASANLTAKPVGWIRSLLDAREDNFYWDTLPLRPKGSLAIVDIKSEGASWIDRVRAEDALTLSACYKADLATLALYEANNCSAHARWPSRACWSRRSGRTFGTPVAPRPPSRLSARRDSPRRRRPLTSRERWTSEFSWLAPSVRGKPLCLTTIEGIVAKDGRVC